MAKRQVAWLTNNNTTNMSTPQPVEAQDETNVEIMSHPQKCYDELLACAVNLHIAYACQTGFKSNQQHRVPTFHFIKVALASGVPKTIRSLHAVFPIDRDWFDQADFRGHLRKYLGEESHERILAVANNVAHDAVHSASPWLDPSTYANYVSSTTELQRWALAWTDKENEQYMREIYRLVRT